MSGPSAVRSIRVERENGVGSAGIGYVRHSEIRVARNRRADTVASLLRPDLEADLTHEAVAPLQPAPQRLDKIAIALGPLCLGGSLRALGQWRRDRKPKADEEGHCLDGNRQVAFDTLELAGMPVEASHESGFPRIGTVRGEHRCDRR